MKKSIVGLCLCLSLTSLALTEAPETFASENEQTSGTSSSADAFIKNVKEILFDLETDEEAEDLLSVDPEDELEEEDDSAADLQEDITDISLEPDISDSYTYLIDGSADLVDPDPSEEDTDLRQALAALEEKIEKEGMLSATRAAKGGIWGEANELSIREEMVQFALQYVGNPYVWGGTSLTNGADCSGFVLAVHNHFGYALPRVAADQYAASRKKDISSLEPGDLVFYGNGISHVAMYIGDGQIVHAANSRLGIIVSDITWMNPVGGGTFLD